MSHWFQSQRPRAPRPAKPGLSLCELDPRVQPAVGLSLLLNPSAALGSVSGLLGGVAPLLGGSASSAPAAPGTMTSAGAATPPAPSLLGGVTDLLGLSNATGPLLGAAGGTVAGLLQSVTTLVPALLGPAQTLPVSLPAGSALPESGAADPTPPDSGGDGAAPATAPGRTPGALTGAVPPAPGGDPGAPAPTSQSGAEPSATGPAVTPPVSAPAPQAISPQPTRSGPAPLAPADPLASSAGGLPAAQSPADGPAPSFGTTTTADTAADPAGLPVAPTNSPDSLGVETAAPSGALSKVAAEAGAARSDGGAPTARPVVAESQPASGNSVEDGGPSGAGEVTPGPVAAGPAEEVTPALAYAAGALGLPDQFFPNEFTSLREELDACLDSLSDALTGADDTSALRWVLNGFAGSAAFFAARHKPRRAKPGEPDPHAGRTTRRIPLGKLPD